MDLESYIIEARARNEISIEELHTIENLRGQITIDVERALKLLPKDERTPDAIRTLYKEAIELICTVDKDYMAYSAFMAAHRWTATPPRHFLGGGTRDKWRHIEANGVLTERHVRLIDGVQLREIDRVLPNLLILVKGFSRPVDLRDFPVISYNLTEIVHKKAFEVVPPDLCGRLDSQIIAHLQRRIIHALNSEKNYSQERALFIAEVVAKKWLREQEVSDTHKEYCRLVGGVEVRVLSLSQFAARPHLSEDTLLMHVSGLRVGSTMDISGETLKILSINPDLEIMASYGGIVCKTTIQEICDQLEKE